MEGLNDVVGKVGVRWGRVCWGGGACECVLGGGGGWGGAVKICSCKKGCLVNFVLLIKRLVAYMKGLN